MRIYTMKLQRTGTGIQWIPLIFCGTAFFMALSVLRWYTDANHYSDYLLRSLEGPIKFDDPELIAYIQDNILEPPSKGPYNIEEHVNYYVNRLASETFYNNFSRAVLASKRNGFFVDAGAFDGQVLSNTLELEMKQGWTGLLVEPDPGNYRSLKSKRRKAWTAQACLSITNHPKQEKFSFTDVDVTDGFKDTLKRSMNSMISDTPNSSFYLTGNHMEINGNSYAVSQCFPLGSFLLALNVTRIDLLSLDVEFVEEEIIRNFDFDRFDVQVIYLEWWKAERAMWLKDFLEGKGFVFVLGHPGDYIFIKKTSDMLRIAEEKRLRSYVFVISKIDYEGRLSKSNGKRKMAARSPIRN